MTVFLRPDVHLAHARDDLVILDLKSDAYLVLRGMSGRCAAAPSDGRLTGEGEALTALEAGGFTGASPFAPHLRPATAWSLPSRDLLDETTSLRSREILAGLGHLAFSAGGFAGRPVKSLLGRRFDPDAGSRGAPDAPAALIREAVRFRDISAMSPWSGECLFQAYALRRRLRLRRLDAAWVFAVRTWPFEAHCWLQVGDLVLNDVADRLVGFTPILVA